MYEEAIEAMRRYSGNASGAPEDYENYDDYEGIDEDE